MTRSSLPARPRSTRRPGRVLALAASAVLAVGLSGCGDDDDSSSDGGDGGGGDDTSAEVEPVPAADVEEQITTQLTEEVGQAPDSVSCPDDLESEEGATLECTLTAGPDEVGVTVTVTGVKDGTTSFDIQVDDEVQ